MKYDCLIIGGGIVGLATGLAVLRRTPGKKLLSIEKESVWGAHQTGHNSGVIHSGIYYAPGSKKALLCNAGRTSMLAFCREHGIPHEVCGKIIIATTGDELPRLETLRQRASANGVDVRLLTRDQAREIEPHVECISGLAVPGTGIVDFKQVCVRMAELLQAAGAELRLDSPALALRPTAGGYEVDTPAGVVETGFLVNCAGLHSDRVARMAGLDPRAKIVPFRGEYYELKPDRRNLVRNLIYPVPNPAFPFLGVHYTRMIDGNVHCGPNAVLALKREGYHKTDVSLRDAWESLTYPGFWKLARKNLGEGWQEVLRSFSKQRFTRSLQRMIPSIREDDLVPSHAGVRAQALDPAGKLVDDFLFVKGPSSLHVCNAPSPAATSSLEIGEAVAEQMA
ncbi:MAG: L-2-hydroxyglutarate oxidase [Kiritimatiellia bacterium]